MQPDDDGSAPHEQRQGSRLFQFREPLRKLRKGIVGSFEDVDGLLFHHENRMRGPRKAEQTVPILEGGVTPISGPSSAR